MTAYLIKDANGQTVGRVQYGPGTGITRQQAFRLAVNAKYRKGAKSVDHEKQETK